MFPFTFDLTLVRVKTVRVLLFTGTLFYTTFSFG